MGETIRHLVWFAIVATAVSYCVLVVLGNFLTTSAEDTGPLQVRDVLSSPNVHDLSGILMVPSTCDELLLRTQELSTGIYELVFQTWPDPSVACISDQTPREFDAVMFAPSTGIRFIATLNGNEFPVVVVPQLAHTSP